eukprot:NODE_656_length_4979_cov_1.014754.p1 type:complete len:473 gc:universal NODE_656_length_4979_cov_1.014754:3725-2307(-)
MLRRVLLQKQFDVAVIGGGPGGYVAAIKAAQLGKKVACIDKRGAFGGTCLNVGCIPSKALLHDSHLYHAAKHDFEGRGIVVENVKLDLSKMMARKESSVSKLTSGIEMLFKGNKVTAFKGAASFKDKNTLVIESNKDQQTITAENIIIATGSEPAVLPGFTADEKTIVTSTGALSLDKVPENLIVIGAGVIGLELGSVWSRLGSKVTVIEYMPSIGAGMDADLAKQFQRLLKKQNLEFKMDSKVVSHEKKGDGYNIIIETKGKTSSVYGDVILLATGRRAFTDNLKLENAGLKTEKGKIEVNEHFQTNSKNIYAIGDVIKGPMLAHKAEEEGIAVAELVSGQPGHVNYDAIPSVIYTNPEVAWVGLNEQELKAKKIDYKKGQFPFIANSRAKTNDETEGFVKILTDAKTDQILGAHIIGTNAGEMIAEGVIAIEYGASSEDIARTCHAHPTLSEAFKEACLMTHGVNKAIHI